MHAIMVEGKPVVISLDRGEKKDIQKDIAEIWLKTGEVIKVDDGSKDKEIARLKAENEKLKAQAESEKCAEGNAVKDELLAKCKKLGIRVTNPNTKIETLQKKIAEAEKELADKTAE